MIQLRSSHIILPQEIVQQVFGEEYNIYMVYQQDKQRILAVPVSSSWFTKIYEETKQALLKLRNAQGDCSLPIGELIIDYEIDHRDRELAFDIETNTGLLKIELR